MKHPYTIIFLLIALVIPNSIALLFYNWQGIKSLGFIAIIFFSVIFSSVPVIIWYFVSVISVWLTNKPKVHKNTVEFNEYPNSTSHSIIVSSIASIVYSFVFLTISVSFSLGFLWFIILCYLMPIFRLFISFFEYCYLKKNL